MGIGFPSRPLRSAFGPKLLNAYPVENTETQIGDRTFNCDFWQVAGMGLIAPRAVLVGSYSGSTLTTKHQAEAWNPNNDQAHPTPARSGTGVYSYTFASTYKDEDGNDVTTVLLGARVLPQGEVTSYANRIVFHAWIDPAAPLVARWRFWETSAGDPVDVPFWLEVL